MTHLIKIYHGFRQTQSSFQDFLDDIQKTMTNQTMMFGLHANQGELLYSFDASPSTYASFESQFYTDFNDFQIVPDDKNIWNYESNKTVVGEVYLENGGFFPFAEDRNDDSAFIDSILRSLEGVDIATEKVSYIVQITPLQTESLTHFLRQKFDYRAFRWMLRAQFPKYMMMRNLPKEWKKKGHAFFAQKRIKPLFATRIAIIAQASTQDIALGKLRSVFNKFLVLKDIPYNQFLLRTTKGTGALKTLLKGDGNRAPINLTSHEIAEIFHFPARPDTETSLLTVKSKKLGVPVGVPSLPHKTLENGEIVPVNVPREMTPLGISDYRSTRVPLAVYDEDRLRHTYVVGKTGTGKSKFLLSLMIRDIQAGKGIGVIDPHGDLISELITHIPPERKDDVIIFDPTDEEYPFCLNPLDVKETESKQILAK
ncbi:MAG: DUF87 domain-containing protein [Candidatus Peribacteria bacterium]|nr:MAG: DUF87 domain-containing protein [Candidatus Peribacteria bacterium]